MHEFVLSGAPAKRELGVTTLDIAKRLLDFGFHPPTIYFPLLVDEALMFEPTETETRESLDALAAAIDAILAEAERDPEIARGAPTPPRSAASTRRRRAASRSLRQPLATARPRRPARWRTGVQLRSPHTRGPCCASALVVPARRNRARHAARRRPPPGRRAARP